MHYCDILTVLFLVVVAVAQHDLLQVLLGEAVPLVGQDVLVQAKQALNIHTGGGAVLEHGEVSRAHALREGAGSPREYSSDGLDVVIPRVLLQHIVQLDLELLAHLTRDAGHLVPRLLHQLHGMSVATPACSSSLVM